MNRQFEQKLMTKTIPLSLLGLGLLFISKPAAATGNISIDSDALNNLRQKAIAQENNDDSRPTLISNQMFKKALLTSFSENLKQNQSTFPNLSAQKETGETEFTIAKNIQFNQDNFEGKRPSLVALEWQSNESTPLNIPVSGPANKETKITNSISTPSSVDPTNYAPETENKPVLITPTQQAANFQESEAIPIPIISPVINTEVETRSDSGQSDSVNTGVLNNFNHKFYKVKSGDTVHSIARSYGISKNELMRANNLSNPNLIKINQALMIPAATSKLPNEPILISVKPEEQTNRNNKEVSNSIQNLPVKPNNQDIITDNRQNDPSNYSSSQPKMVSAIPIDVEYYNPMNQPTPGKMVSPDLPQLYPPNEYLPNSNQPFNGYIWPTKGVLTSGYGWRWGRMHKGIDIAAPVGTPIVAASDGEVISAGWNSGGYGNLVKLKHFDGSVTLYAHNSKIFVRRGQRVAQGQQIAALGNTGYSTGPHLHFEIHPRAGKAANPIAFLPRK